MGLLHLLVVVEVVAEALLLLEAMRQYLPVVMAVMEPHLQLQDPL
jgi:hypothetical protein